MTQDNSFEISLADYYWDIVEDFMVLKSLRLDTFCQDWWNITDIYQEHLLFNTLRSHKIEECMIELFWKLESVGTNSNKTDDEGDIFLRMYQNQSIEFPDNKYIAKLQWKHNHNETQNRKCNQMSKQAPRFTCKVQRHHQGTGTLRIYRKNWHKCADPRENSLYTLSPSNKGIEHDTNPNSLWLQLSSNVWPAKFDWLSHGYPQPKLNDLTCNLWRLKPVALSTDIEKDFLHVGLHEDNRHDPLFMVIQPIRSA